ncbi:MAG: hypothetical protein L0219_09815 [Phycisphaerales bacterium]|nr:hypothetical protein [Phycisphaerales bacterium]
MDGDDEVEDVDIAIGVEVCGAALVVPAGDDAEDVVVVVDAVAVEVAVGLGMGVRRTATWSVPLGLGRLASPTI